MEEFRIAHFREQGQDVVLALVSNRIQTQADKSKEEIRQTIENCAHMAGLAGTVALVWIVVAV